MERDWVDELERWLQDSFAELCETIGQPVPPAGLRINPALGIEESKYFLLGLEAGLFQPDELGYVQSELLPPLSKGNTRQKMCQIFWYNPLPPRLFRECVCQLSTASSLILERGWLESHILLEPDYKDDRAMSYGIDILVKSPTGQIFACVEVKRSVAELQKLITDLRACCQRGAHAKDDCGFPQNHPKYEFCAIYKPTYFWAVAPDADVCFRMKYQDDSIGLEELTSLPPRSMIESH
jgi:hypothetical protein